MRSRETATNRWLNERDKSWLSGQNFISESMAQVSTSSVSCCCFSSTKIAPAIDKHRGFSISVNQSARINNSGSGHRTHGTNGKTTHWLFTVK